MRSRNSVTVSDRQVQMLAEDWLRTAMPLRDVGWKCTSRRLWQIVLLAAARMSSVFAVCRDLVGSHCDQAVRNSLTDCLPARPLTLEQLLHPALCGPQLPGAIFRKARQVAIDWHLIPYHGQPHRHANELYHSLPRSGTSKFHAYATACVVEQGYRYTLAATSVKGSESPLAVLERVLDRLQARGLKIKVLLLDRQFFSAPVLERLQQRRIPFLMPVARARPQAEASVATRHKAGRMEAARFPALCRRTLSLHVDGQTEFGLLHRGGGVQELSPRQNRASAARAPAVRSLERERRTGRTPGAVSTPVRNRVQLPTARPGPHPDLHDRSGAATVLRAGGAGAEKRLGLAALHVLCRAPERRTRAASGTSAFPPDAALDRQRHHTRTSRRFQFLNATST